MAVTESTLLISGTDHRVVDVTIVPVLLIADVIVNEWQHDLHQLIRRLTTGCSTYKYTNMYKTGFRYPGRYPQNAGLFRQAHVKTGKKNSKEKTTL